jgi:hypothetical protein
LAPRRTRVRRFPVNWPPLGSFARGRPFSGAIYDAAGFYAAAFAAGIVFNLAHLTVIGALVWRQRTGAGERSR